MEENNTTFTYKYPRPAVTTDCVIFGFDGHDLMVLLIERGAEPYKGMWAFPGGFMRMDETLEECALRELEEETSLQPGMVEQFHAFSSVHRDPRERVITVAFYALVKMAEVRGGDDANDARWFKVDDVPPLAFDHDYILRVAMKQLRESIFFKPIGFELLGDVFSVPQLQRLYEAILGVQFDRRNFYRKIMQLGILEPVEEPVQVRPSRFFGKKKEMKELDIDELFGEKKASSSVSMSLLRAFSSSSTHKEAGRKPQLFRFNRKKYELLKERGDFRLEW
ncbi:MAG: NUDIX hydrolase [Bacteroidales bacterium]|nr:NUDIX hydrolase [Bacteroidales bacterium]